MLDHDARTHRMAHALSDDPVEDLHTDKDRPNG